MNPPVLNDTTGTPAPESTLEGGGGPHPCATHTAILDAAEALFGENGVDATSIRQITKRAAVNLAAVNYHFRTKQHLALAVYARRIEPVNRQRIALLDELERAADGQPVELEKILEAIIKPMIQDAASGNRHEMAFMLLMGRCFQEHGADVSAFVNQQFEYVVKRFDAAILRAVPGLSPENLFWRLSFIIGSLHHSLDIWARYESHPAPRIRDTPFPKPACKEFAHQIITFAAAGLRAGQ